MGASLFIREKIKIIVTPLDLEELDEYIVLTLGLGS